MQLRKDPITRSWVITGDDVPDSEPVSGQTCSLCSSTASSVQVVSTRPGLQGDAWSARAIVHPTPLYHIEGEPGRRADGLYDQMSPVGAHEVLVENPKHNVQLWQASDDELEQFLLLIASRIQDLKQDRRFKYVSVFKNYGSEAGQEFDHPNTQLTATTFVPRRVLYELRAGRGYYQNKERCVFCDILNQEQKQDLRVLEVLGDYIATCPYAPRVPYETWIMPRNHEAAFERLASGRPGMARDLGTLLRRTLQRILTLSDEFHMVLHTSPNTLHRSDVLDYWTTIDEDYHWHIEILPKLASKPKSYSFKEVYYSPVTSETAVRRLREAKIAG
jgi:UDPglucose--hexose-1-phosphate uridylyltransferase